jgi:hypothetical protein
VTSAALQYFPNRCDGFSIRTCNITAKICELGAWILVTVFGEFGWRFKLSPCQCMNEISWYADRVQNIHRRRCFWITIRNIISKF